MFDLAAIQTALDELGIDGWLLYDFRGSNVLARRVLDIDARAILSRRFFYFVPRVGSPTKLTHRIEAGALDHLPGEKRIYLRWDELERAVTDLLRTPSGSAAGRKIAMEYSPRNANPYVSRVDAGTIELARSAGAEIVPSGDLIQRFEATWDDDQWRMHLAAAVHTRSAYDVAWGFIAERTRAGQPPKESDVQNRILEHFRAHGLVTDHPPIVGVGPHSGDPHYATTPASDVAIREGDFVLIDLWAKLDQPRSVYSDLTQVAFVGAVTPAKHQEIFRVVAAARDAAIDHARRAFKQGRPLPGWEVDQAAREVIEKAGYGAYFVHRTGHNIGQETHGNGANMDNLETREDRLVARRTCFSIEPGIYLPEFGVRSEVNVFISPTGEVIVTGGEPQTCVPALLA